MISETTEIVVRDFFVPIPAVSGKFFNWFFVEQNNVYPGRNRFQQVQTRTTGYRKNEYPFKTALMNPSSLGIDISGMQRQKYMFKWFDSELTDDEGSPNTFKNI
jgi:hypothetical protein